MNTHRASLCVPTGLAIVLALTACESSPQAPMTPDDGPAPSSLVAARPYQATLPDSDARPAPLVLVLHGLSATGPIQDAYFGFSKWAKGQGIITAYPDGTKNSLGARFWNATNSCCDFENSKVDDVAYLTAVIDDAIARYGADPRRVYLVGHSNGGYMAYRMACDRADRIAGIASLAGANWKDTSRCRPSVPVPVVQIHGTKDDNVPYAGNVVTPTAKESVASFAATNGCGATPADGPARDIERRLPGSETTVLRWQGCKGGAAELWTITDGAHIPTLTADFPAQVYGSLSAFSR